MGFSKLTEKVNVKIKGESKKGRGMRDEGILTIRHYVQAIGNQ